MEKIKIIIISVLILLIFSGCSLPGTINTSGGISGFTMTKSLWKSADGGNTWQVKNKGEGSASITSPDILSFAINPHANGNIYAGLRKGGILETTDGGETWKFMNFQSEKVYGLALDPQNGKTLYASGVWQGRGKIFKTEDRGANWKEIYTSPKDGPLIISLTVDKKNPGVIYATTSDKEALKSTDSGASWKNINLANSPVLKITVDAQNSDLIYSVTLSGEIFRSRDGGEKFERLSNEINKSLKGAGGTQFTVAEADPSIPGRVWVAGSGGIARSNDGGDNWEKIKSLNNPQNFPVKVLAVNPNNSQEIVYGASQTVYKSEDGGITWTTYQFDNKLNVNVIKYDPSSPGYIYLGFTK